MQLYEAYLLHFHHKGGRVCFKVIIHTDSGENLVSNAEWCIGCRYVRACNNESSSLTRAHANNVWGWTALSLTYLSHDLTQRHLFEVGGFPTHVGPSDDDEIAALGDVGVVRHRHLSSHLLQDRVATLLDSQSICEIWAHWQREQKTNNHPNRWICWLFFNNNSVLFRTIGCNPRRVMGEAINVKTKAYNLFLVKQCFGNSYSERADTPKKKQCSDRDMCRGFGQCAAVLKRFVLVCTPYHCTLM